MREGVRCVGGALHTGYALRFWLPPLPSEGEGGGGGEGATSKRYAALRRRTTTPTKPTAGRSSASDPASCTTFATGANAINCGVLTPVAKVVGVLLPAAYRKIALLPRFATNRLPLPSNARPWGLFSPVAKVVGVVSPAAIRLIVLSLAFVTNKSWVAVCARGARRDQRRGNGGAQNERGAGEPGAALSVGALSVGAVWVSKGLHRSSFFLLYGSAYCAAARAAARTYPRGAVG